MLETYELPVEDLTPFEGNPRQGNVELVAESLAKNGQYRAIVVNKGTITGRPLEVLAGNHTLQAAISLGWGTITAHLLDVDQATAKRIVLVDNRSNDLSTNDDRLVLALLDGLDADDLEGSGYNEQDVEDLGALLNQFDWEGEDAQGALDGADETAWPTIKAKLPPHNHARFLNATGEDDGARILDLLQRAGL